MIKRPSMRKAINDKCKECIYDVVSGPGTWRQQVEACTSRSCPLYAVRPISSGEKAIPLEVS
jgi:hypothetical protein